MGIWPGHRAYILTRSAMGFLMTTESQDLGLTSHLKDSSRYNMLSTEPAQTNALSK